MPPPAKNARLTCGQWSRPAAAVDPRRAAEFAPGDHRHVIEHAPDVQVFNQGTQALVELGTVVAHQPEIVAVGIPAAVRERHAAHAGLDQPRAISRCSLTVGAPSY